MVNDGCWRKASVGVWGVDLLSQPSSSLLLKDWNVHREIKENLEKTNVDNFNWTGGGPSGGKMLIVVVRLLHPPRNFGRRLSMKAAIPSRASSVPLAATIDSFSASS